MPTCVVWCETSRMLAVSVLVLETLFASQDHVRFFASSLLRVVRGVWTRQSCSHTTFRCSWCVDTTELLTYYLPLFVVCGHDRAAHILPSVVHGVWTRQSCSHTTFRCSWCVDTTELLTYYLPLFVVCGSHTTFRLLCFVPADDWW
jgi:hypothetical protein